MKIAVCAICRNEVDYVEEWVSYYKVTGFDSVFVYDNVSDDGTSELLSALDRVGEITRVHWPRREGIPPQRDAYGHFLEHFASAYDYVLICDLDEFLVVEGGTIKSLLLKAETKYSNVGAIAFPWRIFGSSGHELKASDLVIERFNSCDAKPSVVVKTMFSPKNTYNMRTHICDLLSGVYLDNTLAVADWNQRMPIKLKTATLGMAVVNHYYTKSRQEWTARRSLPKADRAILELKNTNEFDKYHNQKHESLAAKAYVPAVYLKRNEIRDKLQRLKCDLGSYWIELICVSKDWIFGVVHGLSSSSSQKMRILNGEGKETMFNTKPLSDFTHLFTVKTKWRNSYSEIFSVSVAGGTTPSIFPKADWPIAERSLELLVKYAPDAEEHIFSIFINTLEKKPSEKVINLMVGLDFAKYSVMRGFVSSLARHIADPAGRHLKVFLSSCTDEFVKQVADPRNKKRKFITDAVSK